MSNLANKLAVVSGAAQGLGQAFTQCLAENGARVLAFDIQSAAAATLAPTENVTFVEANVALREDVERIASKAQAMGGADILVNNAAQWRKTPVTSAWDQALADWDTVMDTNLKGVLMLSRALVPQLIQRGGGDIINISTDYVLPVRRDGTNPPDTDLYSASKWALNGFTDAWAKYLAPHNIRVNALCMGPTDTPMLRGLFPEGALPPELEQVVMPPSAIANLLLELLADGRSGENIGAWAGEPVALDSPKPLHQQITG